MSAATYFLVFLAVVVALAVAYFQYFFRQKPRGKNYWLFPLFRFLSVFCLLLLLIDPKIEIRKNYSEKPNLVLAVDNSASIKYSGAAEEVSAFVNDISKNKNLRERFDIEVFTFGTELNRTDSLDFSAPQTNISSALIALEELYKNAVAPTILITDGNQTFGENPVFAARQYGQPIFAVAVGDTATYQDLSLSRINVNKYAFLDNKFPVEIITNYAGEGIVSSTLEIKSGKEVVFSKEISFDKDNNSKIVEAVLPAAKVGVQIYEARLLPIKNERNLQNNSRQFAVEVVDEQVSVLLATSIVHPDLGAIKKAVESNKQRKITISQVGEKNLDTEDYQLVIVYQPQRNFKGLLEKITALKKPFWIITGPETDWRFLNSAQNIFQKEITGQVENFFAIANEEYSAFQLDEMEFDGLPPLEGSFGTMNFSRHGEAILYKKIAGVETGEPLMITFHDGKSKKGILTGANIWRWRSEIYRENGSFENFDHFIGNLVQYLAETEKRERLVVNSQPFYYSNEEIKISAQYFDANYEFDARRKLSLELINEVSGKKSTFPLLLRGNRYEVGLGNLQASDYSFSVKVSGEKFSKSGKFKVLNFEVEQQFSNANVDALRNIAKESGGDIYFLNNPINIVKELLSGNKFLPVQKSRKNNVSLVEWYILLGIIIFSLGAEWFLRKYRGLI